MAIHAWIIKGELLAGAGIFVVGELVIMKAERNPYNRVRNLQLMSFYFLLNFAAGGFIISFLSLYFHKIQVNVIQVHTIGTIGGLMGLVGGFFWGCVFDRVRQRQRTLLDKHKRLSALYDTYVSYIQNA